MQIIKRVRRVGTTYKMLGLWGTTKESLISILKLDSTSARLREKPSISGNFIQSHSVKKSNIVKYNLNFDDLLPKYSNLALLKKLVGKFPNIKITMFMSINSRLARDANIFDYPAWCEEIKNLPKKNFEIGIHGYYHHINDWHNTPEFKYLSKRQARDLLLACERALKKSGIKFVRGFRPPRWELSKGTEKALEELNYSFLSDSPKFYQEHLNIRIPRIFPNSDIEENLDYGDYVPYRDILLDPQEYYIHRGHLFDYCDNNLTPETFDNIVKTIKSFRKVKFVFLSEMVRDTKYKNNQKVIQKKRVIK
ncbi:hypothetical protein A2955_04005 [Candidatus Woesebacteria bacterium RIFCSPLOWO2_01_FULL_37_19]|uniref:NodB homology domain-containing protein n=2 Tax=Candidatus Woeseibacteriota TaxID=1752722 RepID=A0A1F8B7B9_9BACT|nr:MAG: hypothetical protein A2771_03635 [Candidatus Woesebacteria bacterium RIFCSPHIGHO2_01_FULL_38_26b]OGM59946.1 MAG: hypothetical protein A2955_04005 [Candidatus Woesebacteria bacterium RIFCSPLOWO2_01_FULL_37_19]